MDEWCERRGTAKGGVVSVGTCWELARQWYGGRLSVGWRPRSVSERRAIFESLGLTDEFWRLEELVWPKFVERINSG